MKKLRGKVKNDSYQIHLIDVLILDLVIYIMSQILYLSRENVDKMKSLIFLLVFEIQDIFRKLRY